VLAEQGNPGELGESGALGTSVNELDGCVATSGTRNCDFFDTSQTVITQAAGPDVINVYQQHMYEMSA